MRIYILLFLFAIMICGQQCYAAFPAFSESSAKVETEKRSFEEFINATIEKYNLPAPPLGYGDSEGSPALSIVSLALAISGLGAMVLALELMAAIWLIPAAALGITAIVLGAMGSRRRPMRGVGIAGFALGIVDVSILLVVGFFALIFAAFTGM